VIAERNTQKESSCMNVGSLVVELAMFDMQ